MATWSVARIFTNSIFWLRSALFLEIFGCARQYEQALLHSLARKFVRLVRPTRSPLFSLKEISVNFLTFSAALGIVQVNLPSALACTKIREIRGQIKPTYFRTRQNPSLVTGLRCKLYTRNPFDYRRSCELVLG